MSGTRAPDPSPPSLPAVATATTRTHTKVGFTHATGDATPCTDAASLSGTLSPFVAVAEDGGGGSGPDVRVAPASCTRSAADSTSVDPTATAVRMQAHHQQQRTPRRLASTGRRRDWVLARDAKEVRR